MQTALPLTLIKRSRREVAGRGRALMVPATPVPSREMIARRAYEIWRRHGCPAGTAFQDWLAAETALRSQR